jgi:hypothetical protein
VTFRTKTPSWRAFALSLTAASALGATGASGCAVGADDLDDATEPEALAQEQSALTINHRRSLIETNQQLLAPVGLDDVFHFIALNGGLTPTPALTHNLLFNLYNDSSSDVFPGIPASIPHRPCDDPLYQSVLNNFSFDCPRVEGSFATGSLTSAPEMANWKAIAAVNRIDLAPATGDHCGEQRLIMAHDGGPGRDFIIFEAQIPNPSPTNDPCACAPIAEFWEALTPINDVGTRASELGQAFFFGHPTLQAAGFGPFMAAGNFTVGTGQVRTNNFATFPWSLRELKLVEFAGLMFPIPFPVAANLQAPLLDDNSADPRAAVCRQAFLDALGGLTPNDVNLMALDIPPQCLGAESPNDFFTSNYEAQVNGSNPLLLAQVQVKLTQLNSSLTPTQIATRASFAGSCIGCHQESTFQNLGGGITAPGTLGFVHVSEFGSEDCGDSTSCFPISPALTNDFLPHRETVMSNLLTTCGGDSFAPIGGGSEAGGGELFDAGGIVTEDGELDVEQLKAIDAASKPEGLTIGGVPLGRAH